MPNTFNHAIIGCGRIAPNHADAFSQAEGVNLTTVYDTDTAKAQKFADDNSIPFVAPDIDHVLNSTDINSLSIALPHDLHHSIALAAINAGKHVLIEKPFTITSAEAKEIMELSAARQIIAFPVAQHHYDHLILSIRDMIKEGALGDIFFVSGYLECNRPDEYYAESDWRGIKLREGGSVLINQAYHIVDLMIWLCGEIYSVTAQMHTFNKEVIETEDVFSASVKFKNNALGTLGVCGAGGSKWNSRIEIIGSKGVVAFDIAYPNQLLRFDLNSKAQMKYWRNKFNEDSKSSVEMAPGISYYGNSHDKQAEAFIKAINNQTDMTTEHGHALNVVKTIESLYQSANLQHAVVVDNQS